jgi:hypothetical protein
MNDFREDEVENPLNDPSSEDRSRASMWPGVVIVALIVVAGIAIVYAHSQKADINAMATREASLNANVAQLHNQLQSTTAKLDDMVAQQQQQAAAQAAEAQKAAEAKRHAAEVRAHKAHVYHRHVLTASEKRYKAVQARLDAQQKELDATNSSIAQTRSDLQANLDSTRSDLNGSIARNHGELVALEKRGQRSYFEFDLWRSKHFSRTGPISLDLRHADTKHKRYNMMLLVNDNRLEKKNVDLYEPIWISSADSPQPLEIVVNKITKNHIHGYISAPKYSKSQLAAGQASLQPVSASSIASASGMPSSSQSAPLQP